jgi:hypothetical protein
MMNLRELRRRVLRPRRARRIGRAIRRGGSSQMVRQHHQHRLEHDATRMMRY